MKTGIITFFSILVAGSSVAQTKDTLADKLLVYQLPIGAWGKQLNDGKAVNYNLPLDKALLEKIKSTGDDHATIDNSATTREINILLKAYKSTKNPAYLSAAEKGIKYLLLMQYENGGFPQYYPNKQIYRKQITYNDNAMINALTILYNASEGKNDFDAVSSELKLKSKTALKKGIDCILKNQVLQNGIPTIWADQYDEITLQPAKARAFEPVSLATGESVGIVRFLMMQPVTPEIEKSIKSAVKWFKQYKIEGYSYKVKEVNGKKIRVLEEEKGSVVWARFYDIKINKPIFGDRDGSIKNNYEEISEERRNGYSWYIDFASKLTDKEFPKWLTSNHLSE
ncbi:pectate lyase [Epilithonimonas sp. JDS]|uniref:pectate lyase n=1 Tax=Epilithonimonas sp. JDS TaxID=2902797 RepID=UPI001E47E2AD|nr:pectate lyase [Epilithonimonas sp. JDS]MCD9854415.1 pectate lyase [Epilithonimonas sp. JDS]